MKDDLRKQAEKVMAKTYSRFPLVIGKGKGCVLEDVNGRKYLDFVAGIAVCNLGHCHPGVADAIAKQARTLLHVSNLYYTVPQTKLASWIVSHSFGSKVFFCNSGAEANEAAIKLARKYFKDNGEPDRFRIISMERSFHGRTMATLSATGQEKIKRGFEPLLQGFDFVPFNDLDALEKAMTKDTCAVMLEPIQGEGGVRCPDPGYLKGVRKLCNDSGTLLILDEIQTGMGRTGRLFCHEHFNVEPDIMTLAKALGNGMPLGAMVAKENVAEAFSPGSHATTFGGTPIATAAALSTVQTMESEGIIEHGRDMGDYFRKRLEQLKERYRIIEDVRGMGLLLGMKLKGPGQLIVKECMEKGFLINCVQENILRFIPPLIIEKEQIDSLIECLEEVLEKYNS